MTTLVERLRAEARTHQQYSSAIVDMRATTWFQAADALETAEKALDGALPYLETLHSLAQAKDARKLVWKRIEDARAALATIRGQQQ